MAQELSPGEMPPTNWRRRINTVIGVLLLGGLTYCTAGFLTASSRIPEVCKQIVPGMPLAALATFATEHGMGPRPRDVPLIHLVESRTYGRWGCRIEMDKGVVKKATFIFND